jgi:uncharacterized phage-associated protein
MNTAINVAKYMTDLIDVDQLKLEKLLFYTQAVCLVHYGKSAFDDPIEAWDYGPVVPNVYYAVKNYDNPIKLPEIVLAPMDPDIIHSIDLVIEYYGPMSGIALINETHSEKPWHNAYARGKNVVITNEAIKRYYSTIYTFK